MVDNCKPKEYILSADEYEALNNSIKALKRENEVLHNDIEGMKKACSECFKKRKEIDKAKVNAYRDALKIVSRRKK
jgi:cell division septum initiation protein DivIVA